MRPPVPAGPIVSLVYRVAPERRADVLALLRDAFPLYERPGGIRMGLYESMDEPGLWLELVAYAGEGEYAADQVRVESDPEMRKVLGAWKALLAGPVEVRKLRPLALAAAGPGAPRADRAAVRVEDAAFNEHAAVAELLEGAGLPVPDAEDGPVGMLVARDAAGIAGCVGHERYGDVALMRSLAVRPDARRRGVGRALVRALGERLSAGGTSRLVLLTTGAPAYFQELGFTELSRADTPEAVRASREFRLRCCEAAIVMHAPLPFAD